MNSLFKPKINKLFWFLKRDEDLSDNLHMIVHQTLAFGSMDDVQKLFKKYGKETIAKEFQRPVRGIYSPVVLNFFEYILKVKLKDNQQYIKNIYGKTPFRNF